MGECRFDNYDACPCGCGKCLCVECIGEASRLAVVALIHERDGLRADLAAMTDRAEAAESRESSMVSVRDLTIRDLRADLVAMTRERDEAIQLGVDLTNLLHGDESYLRGMSDAREAGVVDRCTERPSVATVARIVEESGTRQLRADLAAARADVERLRAFVRDSAYVVANVRTGDNRCGSCHALIHMCELADPKCRGAAARALLAETAPKGPHADT